MAAEMVGGVFLSAFVQTLFDRMASREMADFIKGIKRDNDPNLLDKLKIAARSVDALVNHAEEKQATNLHIREWLNDLKDAMFEADDLLDEITTTASRHKVEAELEGGASEVNHFSPASLSQFSERMKAVIEKLENLVKQKDILGLREGVSAVPSTKLQTTSIAGKSRVYGRDGDKESIMKLLLSDSGSDRICILPIVGMGGVGKTTIAQLVYNDDSVREYFEIKAWVCVTQDFDVFKLTQTILEAIPLTCDSMDLNQQQIKLKEFIDNKKFLVVLDDIWNEDYIVWENLLRPLEFGAKGSKIIVTTRSEKVASAMLTFPLPIYHLKPLKDDDCWMLFANNVFDGRKFYGHNKLEDIGMKIVKKCGGLPLAAKAVGGLLRSKVDVNEWEKVLESDIWDFPNDRCNILPSLMLSYHYLPSTLQRCFAYCSIFPNNYQFKRKKLVRLWIAEDLLQHPKENRRLEQVGKECFNDLISRSFFQQSSKKSFIVHDLMNDLAEFVSGEFCFRLDGKMTCHMSERTRHMSYSKVRLDNSKKIVGMATCKKLRTFLPSQVLSWSRCLNNEAVSGLLSNLTDLRVLSLSHCRNLTVIPDSLGDLIHLRYLDLSLTAISKLPNSTGSLYNLQTLLLTNCSSLSELPLNMGRLTNLRCLDIRGTKLSRMPSHMGRLRNLQTLTEFIVGNECGSGIKELNGLSFIKGKLSISNLQNVVDSEDAMEANLWGKEKLNELVLKWTGNADNSEQVRSVLNQLQPPKTLKKLTIKGYGSTSFPDWLGDRQFSNIASICLYACKNCILLPPLGELPSLLSLSLVGFTNVVSVGDEFYNSPSQVVNQSQRQVIRPFRSLVTLRFENMPQWQEWFPFGNEDAAEGAFPRLQKLYIKNCPQLMSLPQKLPSLSELVITKCQQLEATVPTAICKLQLECCGKVSMKELLPRLSDLTINGYDAVVLPLVGIDDKSSCIEKLSISSCPLIVELPVSGIADKLKSLSITKCGKIEFPINQCFAFLEFLSMKFSCDSLKSFILDFFPKLSHLDIEGCQNLESLSVSGTHVQVFTTLKSLRISECPNFMSFPESGLSAPNLTFFLIDNCKNLKSLPHQMNSMLPSLVTLNIWLCPELESFSEGGLPKSLNSLEIFHCDKLFTKRKEWDLQKLPSLRSFGIKAACKDGESFPEKWLLPSTLTSLYIRKLENLKCLHEEGLQHMTSLENLGIGGCSELDCMPEKLPASLTALHIWNSPLLEQRCKGEKSKDWHKIAHIPLIRIKRKLIRYD